MRIEDEQSEAADPSDDALDRLLAQARWDEPDPSQLRRRWNAISARRRHWRRFSLVAAMLAVAIGAGVALESMTSIDPAHPDTPKMLSVMPAATAAVLPVRDSTPYERLALLATPTRIARPPATPVRSVLEPSLNELANRSRSRNAEQRLDAMQQLLDRGSTPSIRLFLGCVRDPSRRDDALAVLQRMTAPPIEGLLVALDDSLVANRLAAARALGTICDQRVTARLQQMYDKNQNRREALAAIAACHDQSWVSNFVAGHEHSVVIGAQIRAIRTEMSDLY